MLTKVEKMGHLMDVDEINGEKAAAEAATE